MPKILIADDSIAVRKVAERLLTEAGLGVTLAANGEEALAYLAKERPDVIVSDVIMPDKSGYEVCAFVRKHSTLAATPVLLISGIVNDEVTKQAESCRADGVLKKPFQGTSLKDRVLELLAKRQEPSSADIVGSSSGSTLPLTEKTMPMSEQSPQNLRLDTAKLKEVEDQLREERAHSEELAKRLSQSMEQLARATENELQLATERKRADTIQQALVKAEQQASKIPDLESALKVEQDAVAAFKLEAVQWYKASDRIAELESALHTERTAAEQLVQQLSELEHLSVKAKEMETGLASAEQQRAELHRKIHDLEAELSTERRSRADTMQQLQEAETVAARVQEMDDLLNAERNQNKTLAQQALEAEQATERATKRFEEMASKLSEIAALASQLGKRKGQA